MPMPVLRLAIAGLGTVGAGTINIVQREKKLLQARTGRDIQIVAASVRDLKKSRDCDVSNIALTTDSLSLAMRDDVDVVIELIGGETGIAYQLVKAALENGKHVVTANKALIAHHGMELAALAEHKGVNLAFEAAVAAGVPILSALRTGIAANRIHKISGILNGTCNYILSRMYHENIEMDVVMQEAAANGWLEADPSLDVDGIDAAHKLTILAALSFGTAPHFDAIAIEGIRKITLADVRYANQFGYRIKLIGEASYSKAHGLYQAVYPALVPKSLPLAAVENSFNAIVAEGNALGPVLLQGKGAGGGPTGSAVVSDIITIARGDKFAPFTTQTRALKQPKIHDINKVTAPFYLRLSIADKPGVLAEVTRILGENAISVRVIDQHEITADGAAQVVVLTHETPVGAMKEAFASLAKLPYCKARPVMMPMLAANM